MENNHNESDLHYLQKGKKDWTLFRESMKKKVITKQPSKEVKPVKYPTKFIKKEEVVNEEDCCVEENKKKKFDGAWKKFNKKVVKESPATEVETEPEVTPDTTTPNTPPKKDPFKPPRPVVEPRPKAKEPSLNEDCKKKITESYEDQAHPGVKSFWKDIRNPNSKHPFSKHPFMAVYGDTLSKQAYEGTGTEKLDNETMKKVFGLLNKIKTIEAPHKEKLEELAKDIVVQIWGVPKELLEADITEDTQDGFDESNPEEEDENQVIDDELRKHINKRITLNTLTQGAAVHQMKSMHHLIRDKLNEIDPNIIAAYDDLTRLMHRQNWWVDPNQLIGQLSKMSVGKSEVKWEEDETGEDKPKIKAKAWIFPFLAQELSKGVMELITTHGHTNLDPDTQGKVIKHGDKLAYEPWQIQIGPELWKKFLAIVPRDVKLAELVTELSSLEPDDVHTILANIVDNPEDAKEYLKKIMSGDAEDLV